MNTTSVTEGDERAHLHDKTSNINFKILALLGFGVNHFLPNPTFGHMVPVKSKKIKKEKGKYKRKSGGHVT